MLSFSGGSWLRRSVESAARVTAGGSLLTEVSGVAAGVGMLAGGAASGIGFGALANDDCAVGVGVGDGMAGAAVGAASIVDAVVVSMFSRFAPEDKDWLTAPSEVSCVVIASVGGDARGGAVPCNPRQRM